MGGDGRDTEGLLEEDIPWEVKLLEEYCNCKAELDLVSIAS
jgi:hypothetical protein